MPEYAKKPAIRFKGFTDDWEQRKLGEISSEIGDGLHSAPVYDDNGTYYFINGNNLDGGKIKVDSNETPKVSSSTFMQNDKKLDSSTILLSINGTIGNLAYYKGEPVMLGKSAAYLKVRYADKSFVYTALQTSNIMEKFTLSLTGTTIKNLGLDAIKNTTFLIPNQKEQEKIAKLFTNLDRLITLHQRKYDKLVNIKKAMLEKMFPQDGAKTPAIRFKGFTDDWEQRKLGEILQGLQNNTLSRAELSADKGVAKNIHYGDILVKYGEVLNVKQEKLPMITDEGVLKKFQLSFLQNGDVIIADTAEDSTVGKCTEVTGLLDDIVISGLHTIPYRPLIKFSSGYLGYYMNSNAYHLQLAPLMQGIKVTSISKSAMQTTKIIYSKKLDEQEKIAKLFTNLDRLITLHQRKQISSRREQINVN